MKEIKIVSSNIKSIFYDEDRSELYVFFHSKSMYIYRCDIRTYNSFVSSNDKDAYFSKHIRNKDYIFKANIPPISQKA